MVAHDDPLFRLPEAGVEAKVAAITEALSRLQLQVANQSRTMAQHHVAIARLELELSEALSKLRLVGIDLSQRLSAASAGSLDLSTKPAGKGEENDPDMGGAVD